MSVTMTQTPRLWYDVASAVSLGQRDDQEDAIICDFSLGASLGFAVLADGMGGHAAGGVASKIVVTEVFSELKLQSGDPENMERDLGDILHSAALSANDCIRVHSEAEPGTRGMGATLVAPVLIADRLYWISVGDSPLFLFRDGVLSQLNEDHSMAPQIEFLARSGLMDAATAKDHPDRNCLTSVLAGHQVSRIDCPAEARQIMPGDIIIAASDGLQFLGDGKICDVLDGHGSGSSAEISNGLLRSLQELDDPNQDNISFCVIKVNTCAKEAVHTPDTQTATPQKSAPPAGKCDNVTIVASKSETGLTMMVSHARERRA